MTNTRLTLLLLASIGIGAGSVYWYNKTHQPVCPPSSTGPVVTRIPGGLVEVATLVVPETFSRQYVYTVAGVVVGKTVTQIRVPAHYTYRIKLGPEWRVIRTGKVFIVITPPLEPKIPVAIDTTKLQEYSSGTWVLANWNNPTDLKALEKALSPELARRAHAPAHIERQRDAARRTAEEFVRKWLLTQTVWQTERNADVRVLFSDEPVSMIDAIYPK